jgi:hypothetical protein
MGGMNWGRVLLGGIVAAVVIFLSEWLIHGVVLMDDWMAAMESINRPQNPEEAPIVLYAVISLLFGLALAWTYAGIRPRFGAGPGTALKAGFVIWLVGYALPMLGWVPLGIFNNRMLYIGLGGGLVELIVAALVAGALYSEAQA